MNSLAKKATTSSSNNKDVSTRQNVRVICRVRPQNKKEITSGGFVCVKHNETDIEVYIYNLIIFVIMEGGY